ncbi:hypothetical protein [Solidesulfovibrio sp.]|jgi:uncharacterized membrane protein|uniref:hypothetical protein n=1 Tax=Solidesulfovibrio sp. TaxID=2910990 RepID=UPI002B20417E|nr:hypothetical protein [Solidesulfovibrio sp.]MEA5090642.1 hypothetical protein [Solidesulfovibrio sp.]HML61686.1 hypothetical protein [Solidesulfovibrio sp.]
MEWIFISVAVAIIALAAIFVIAANSNDGATVPGHFDFDKYKSQELSKRGLFDKTKWR